jgi:uncharacterized repeat protein (TIGR03803 family)
MYKSILLKFAFVACFSCAIAALVSAQTVTTLIDLDASSGTDPFAGLVQGIDGNFYGTTSRGGANDNCTGGCGTVFRITPEGTLTTLHSFDGTDGSSTQAGLIQASNGNFYGTTYGGGGNDLSACNIDGYVGCGTVFEITPTGTLTTLHSFDVTDGRSPAGTLVQASNGDLYGTTAFGGAHDDGTVFRVTTGGVLTTLHSFRGADGFLPMGALVRATDGSLYGTTAYGGSSKACAGGCGTVFKITLAGKLTTLHSFDGTDGDGPLGALLQATNGEFYGGTNFGGTGAGCQGNCGTVFEITPTGKLRTLYSFDAAQGATGPWGGLVQGTDGNFYGTTQSNMIFKITPKGSLTTLFTFNFTNGFEPLDGLVQGTDGQFYGTTYQGGADYFGTVFTLSVGLKAFVKTQPTSGAVGAGVVILGNT